MRGLRRGLLALAVAAPLALGVPGVASAAASWTVQPVPMLGAQLGFLNGVSCTSATNCVAVGWIDLGSGTALGAIWNGSTWTSQQLPLPAGTRDGGGLPDAVSCPAANSCVAVGTYTPSAGAGALLAEVWNGSTWTDGTPVNPAHDTSAPSLNGISCVSATSCVAVGDYSAQTKTLAETWNGSTWARTATVTPAANLVDLNAVSCVSATDCVAVGNYTAKTSHVLVEVWNGSSWAQQPAPSPAGVSGIHVTGVSCPAANSCTAVGYGTTTSAAVAFAEHWNGAHWTVQSIPNPSGTGIVPELSAVSCAAADSCIAVGQLSGTLPTALAERSNGHTWAVETTARPEAKKAFNAVSCFAPATCTAVGVGRPSSLQQNTLAEQN